MSSFDNKLSFKNIAEKICIYLKENKVEPDTRLPSEREFMRMWGGSQPTVNKAVSCLIAQGLLRREGRKLYTASAKKSAAKRTATKTIHVVLPYMEFNSIPVVKHNLIEAAHDVVSTLQWSVIPMLSRTPQEQTEQLLQLCKQDCAGFVLWPLAGLDSAGMLHSFTKKKIPFVVCDIDLGDYDFIGIDNEVGARKGVEYMLGCGHTEIAYATVPQTVSSLQSRCRGYYSACLAAKLPESAERIFETGGNGREHAESLAQQLLDCCPKLTAVFCSNDTLALHLMNALKALGLDIPGDISVIGFDDIDASSLSAPTLTTVAQNFYMLSVMAIEMLICRMNHLRAAQSLGPIKIRLEPDLVIRESVLDIR